MRELTDYEIELFDQTGQIPDTKVPFRKKDMSQVRREKR